MRFLSIILRYSFFLQFFKSHRRRGCRYDFSLFRERQNHLDSTYLSSVKGPCDLSFECRSFWSKYLILFSSLIFFYWQDGRYSGNRTGHDWQVSRGRSLLNVIRLVYQLNNVWLLQTKTLKMLTLGRTSGIWRLQPPFSQQWKPANVSRRHTIFRRPKDLSATGCYGKFPFVENLYAFKGEKLGFFSYSCDT